MPFGRGVRTHQPLESASMPSISPMRQLDEEACTRPGRPGGRLISTTSPRTMMVRLFVRQACGAGAVCPNILIMPQGRRACRDCVISQALLAEDSGPSSQRQLPWSAAYTFITDPCGVHSLMGSSEGENRTSLTVPLWPGSLYRSLADAVSQTTTVRSPDPAQILSPLGLQLARIKFFSKPEDAPS